MQPMARQRKMFSFTLDPEVVEKMKAWLEKQELRSNQSAAVELAIREFLERREKKR
jgi:Arc/MetJ-type ribon-helix-helix transcriptional regulator